MESFAEYEMTSYRDNGECQGHERIDFPQFCPLKNVHPENGREAIESECRKQNSECLWIKPGAAAMKRCRAQFEEDLSDSYSDNTYDRE